MNFHTSFLRQIMYDEKAALELDMHLSRLQKAKTELTSQLLAEQDFDADDDENDESNLYDTLAVTLGNKKKWRHSSRYFASVNRVYYAMVMSITILICGVIFLYCFSTLTFLGNQTVDLGAILGARRCEQELVYEVRQIELSATFGPAVADFPEMKLRKLMSHNAHTLGSILRDTRSDDRYQNDATLHQEWTGNIVPIITRTSNNKRINKTMDTSTLFELVAGNAAILSALDYTPQYRSTGGGFVRGVPHYFNKSSHWSMVMDNIPTTLNKFTHDIVWNTARAHRKIVEADQAVLISLLVIAASVPLLLTVLVVVPSFMQVKRERRYVFSLFRRVPEEILSDLFIRHKSIGNTLKNDGNDKNSSYTSSTGGTNSNIELGMNSDVSAIYYLSRFSNAPSWIRMMFIYTVSIMLLMAVLFTSVLMAYNTSAILYRTSGEISRAAERIGDVTEIMSLSQEWIRDDDYIWPDKSKLKHMLKKQIDMVSLTDYFFSLIKGVLGAHGIEVRK